MNSNIFNALSVIKVFGAVLVMSAHYGPVYFDASFYSFGTGCFFVVAGYYALTWERSRGLRYLAKRLLRLYPGFMVAVITYVCVISLMASQPSMDDWPGLLWHHALLLLAANRDIVFALNPAFWSLPVFFTFFLIVALLPRMKPNRWSFIAFALLPIAAEVSGVREWRGGYLELLAFPLHFYAFWLGGLVGRLAHQHPRRPQHRFTWLALALMLLVTLIGTQHSNLSLSTPGYHQLYHLVMVLLYALLLWCVLHSPLIAVHSRLLSGLGSISFGVYLFHNLFIHFIPAHYGWAGAGLALVLSLMLAWVSFRYIETPLYRTLKPYTTGSTRYPPSA